MEIQQLEGEVASLRRSMISLQRDLLKNRSPESEAEVERLEMKLLTKQKELKAATKNLSNKDLVTLRVSLVTPLCVTSALTFPLPHRTVK